MKKFDKVYVEITNVCNLKCKFCDEGNRAKAYMSVNDFRKIINEVKEYTNLIALHVKGEPLLHPKLKEILDVCFENKIQVNITTNAILLEKNIEVLANSKALRQINLSMHALIQNDLEIKENVKRLIQTVCKIRSKNENIIFSYRLWNVKSISENDVNSSILEALGDYYKIQNILERSQKEKFIELDKKIFLNQDIEFEWPSLDKEIISNTGKCYGLRKQIGILVNGDVVPCCLDQNGAICLGNIFECGLEEILNSKKAKNIEKGFQERKLAEELCKRCGFINTRLK